MRCFMLAISGVYPRDARLPGADCSGAATVATTRTGDYAHAEEGL